jgi:hypothetical protein
VPVIARAPLVRPSWVWPFQAKPSASTITRYDFWSHSRTSTLPGVKSRLGLNLTAFACFSSERPRLIGSIRRECLGHLIVLGEAHLRRIQNSYARYYNETRTHLALEKDAPLWRTVKRAGHVLCRPVLGGLHHEYVRI